MIDYIDINWNVIPILHFSRAYEIMFAEVINMKKVRRKSYLFLGLAVFLVASVLLFLVLISFNEPEKLGIKIGLSVFAGLAMVAGLVYIILFFVKTFDPKELEKK